MKTVMGRLNEQNLDGLFLTDDSNIRYVSGYTGTDSFVLLLENKNYFITDYRYSEQAEQECPDFEIICVNRESETLEQTLLEIATSHGLKRLAFEKNHMIYLMYETLKGHLKDTELVPTEDIVERSRYTKSEEEIGFIKKASQIADTAFDRILGYLKPGITEADATLELERIIRTSEADDIAFPIILVSGQNTSRPHGIPSRKKINRGDFITMDFGALYKGYRSDMTRTVIIGQPDQKQQKVYDIVKEAQSVGMEAVKEGVTGAEVNLEVQKVFIAHDYLEFASKGIGHGLGLDIHEKPFLNAKCLENLQANSVITMEPGVYIPFWGGVRIEDTLVVTKDGSESLSLSSKELIVL